jgi:type II secretory pathway component PulM
MRALLLILTLFAGAAAAQLRTIPQDAQRAEMRHVQENVVELNGQRVQLAPGAQIRDASNRIIMPTALPSGSLVKYRLDANGHVRQVWILTPQEGAVR